MEEGGVRCSGLKATARASHGSTDHRGGGGARLSKENRIG